jgi:hypothetical protein
MKLPLDLNWRAVRRSCTNSKPIPQPPTFRAATWRLLFADDQTGPKNATEEASAFGNRRLSPHQLQLQVGGSCPSRLRQFETDPER